MKKLETRQPLNMNKTQTDFKGDLEMPEDEDDIQARKPNAMEACQNSKRHLRFPIDLFKRKASGNSPPLTNNQLKARPRLHIGIHLSPPNRPQNMAEKGDTEIGKLHISPKGNASKSPRGNLHRLIIASKDVKEKCFNPKKPGETRSPKPICKNQKLNEELWEAASKGDLIRITHLLDP
jgi:hypothetical protein